jgi:hypothetical protein
MIEKGGGEKKVGVEDEQFFFFPSRVSSWQEEGEGRQLKTHKEAFLFFSPHMRIITVATEACGYLDALRESCARHCVELVVLGWGDTWRGFQWKSHLVRRFLRERCVDLEEILIVVDGYDSLLLSSKVCALSSSSSSSSAWVSEFERRFSATSKPILLSVDVPRSSLVRYLYRRIFGECRGAYLNAGLYAGRVWALRELHTQICDGQDMDAPATFSLDDQELLMNLCRRAPTFFRTHVALDVEQHVFCNLIGLFDDADNTTTGHALLVQGPGNTDLSAILTQQHLQSTHCRPTRTKIAHLWHCVVLYHSYFWVEALVVVVLALCLFLLLLLGIFFIHKKKISPS